MAAFRSDRTDSGKEYAAATERTNGPGENKTAGTEAGGEQRYSAEEENQREEHKERITPKDISNIHSITREKGQISVNRLSSKEIKALSKWAYKYWNDPNIRVKSPFFRAWFGEWRAHQTGEYITVADIPEYVATNEARKANRGLVQNNDTDWTIQVSRKGETNTISHAGGDKLSEYGLSGIRALIRNAYLFNTELHEHHNNNPIVDRVAFDHKLYALGKDANGNIGLYRITVEEAYHDANNTNERRFHNLKYIEKVATVGRRTAEQGLPGVSTNDSIATDYSIADLYSLVKQFDSDFTPAKEVNPFFLNDDGTPKMFYHGAKNGGGFEVFKNWQYFTEQEQYAQRYAKRDDPSAMYAVYLTADKVFDTRNADAAKAFESIRQEYGLSELQDTGLPDWTDGYDITDYLSEHPELGYDAVLLDEGGDLVDGKPVSRGTSIVIKNPTQVKSATENIGTYDRGNENYRYSVEDDDLEYLSLAEKYRDGTASEEETAELQRMVEQAANKIMQRGYLDAEDR